MAGAHIELKKSRNHKVEIKEQKKFSPQSYALALSINRREKVSNEVLKIIKDSKEDAINRTVAGEHQQLSRASQFR